MRYADLRRQRDEAIARAVAAERVSLKSEFDRVTREFEAAKGRLIAQAVWDQEISYRRGFIAGANAMSDEFHRHLDAVHARFDAVAFPALTPLDPKEDPCARSSS